MTGHEADEQRVIEQSLGPRVIEVMRRIDRLRKPGAAVPPEEWNALRCALAERLEPEVLDSPLGRAVISELLKRSSVYADGSIAIRDARCGLPAGSG